MSSFNRHIVFMVLLCMVVQLNGVLACYGLFFLKRKVIAETVCEKKTRNCCGHCFLKKKIVEASGSRPEDSRQHSASKSLDEQLSVMEGVAPDSQLSFGVPVSARRFAVCQHCDLRTGFVPWIDHPPEA